MAENKDLQQIKEFQERQKKYIEEQNDHLKSAHGYSKDSIIFDIKETPNGYAMVIRGRFDPSMLDSDWKYEPSYLLNSDYPQEGIWRMKDGKREFVPIVHEQNANQVVEYKTPIDVRDALLANNPQIEPDQIQIDPVSGRGEISLIGVLVGGGHIKMPQGLEMQDGKLIDMNDPTGRTYEIKQQSAHENYNPMVTSGEAVNTDNIKQSALQEDVVDYKEKVAPEIDASDINLMAFDGMKNAWLNYTKTSSGDLQQKQKDDTYKSADEISVVTDPKIRTQYEFASMWVEAYERASGLSNTGDMAFSAETTRVEYSACMQVVSMCRGKSLEDVAEALFNLYEFENSGLVKTVLHFVSMPKIAQLFQINCSEMTVDSAIAKVDLMKNQKLDENFSAMIKSVKENMNNVLNPNLDQGLDMDENAPQMEKKKTN